MQCYHLDKTSEFYLPAFCSCDTRLQTGGIELPGSPEFPSGAGASWCGSWCSSEPLGCYSSSTECAVAGGNWCSASWGEYCDSSCHTCSYTEPWNCDSSTCAGVGALYCNDYCVAEPSCPVCSTSTPWYCYTQSECSASAGTWCSSAWCSSDPAAC